MGNRNGQDAGPSISNDREAHRLVSHIPLTRRTLLCTILAVDSRKGSLIPTLARTASRRRPSLKEDIVPFSECRSNLAACFARVNETHRPLIVTRKGRADAVLVSAADFDPLMDVFLLADTVRKSRKEIAEGRGVDHETAMQQFRERHGI